MEKSDSGNSSIPGTRKVALKFDLNNTPPPSPPQEPGIGRTQDKTVMCSTECRGRKRLRRSQSAGSSCGFDLNVSPPPEVDDVEVELKDAVLFLFEDLCLDDEYA